MTEVFLFFFPCFVCVFFLYTVYGVRLYELYESCVFCLRVHLRYLRYLYCSILAVGALSIAFMQYEHYASNGLELTPLQKHNGGFMSCFQTASRDRE